MCATINKKILCLHGGIPEDINILKRLKNKKLYVVNDIENDDALFQILWNDPKETITGFTDSYRGPGLKFFGEDAFNDFINKNNLTHIIRAHECFPEGYRWFFNKRLLSIFSAANYRGEASPNPASYAIIRGNKVFPKTI